ncbi:DUF2867 domain-containing protein [Marinobacterium arenosum]|uniref:DUF2867 domain-containing protein n=1 Tax=Marinobacterium arenosum TaxID=2862496 RepID=UPI001C93EF9A|nr:DUF2867 domain-containing protein [Marinobacterium arenosum]MBY4675231.1 DUF2867 domain-containing protein [Marinobacterium arenosum]
MSIPGSSEVWTLMKGAYFYDSHSTKIRYDNQSALDVYFVIVRETPGWVNWLMSMRNKIVSKLGLKNLGHMSDIDFNKPSCDYKVGDRVGIFTVYANSNQEVILEDKDKHLDVRVSFYIEPEGDIATVHASTVVHVKNMLGKVYMFFVAPVHKIIVPTTLKKLPKA